MRYYPYPLWQKINSSDAKTRYEAAAEWERRDTRYRKHLARIRPRLPQDFLDLYDRMKQFHNWLIRDIRIVQGSPGQAWPYSTEIQINNGRVDFILAYGGVRGLRFNCRSKEKDNPLAAWNDPEHWGYDEFTLLRGDSPAIADVRPADGFTHEILFDSGNSLWIAATDIRVREPALAAEPLRDASASFSAPHMPK